MRQRIDGNEDDGIRYLLDDLHDAYMPESPEQEEPPEPEGPPEPEEPEPTAKAFYDMMAAAKRPLYEGAKISQLDAIAQVLADKAQFDSTRACFEKNLVTVGNMLPEGHCLPKTMYAAKKMLKALSMDYVKYHEITRANGEKVQTKVAVKILRYLPFIKRIQRLYMSEESAKQMTWHKNGLRFKDEEGRLNMGHPSDGKAWQNFDAKHPDKANDARNVRIAIATDGFNPYGWEVVFKVSPHGKLPMPSDEDYNNIDPVTYEGIFYQEQENFGNFEIEIGLEDLENEAHLHGETVVDLKDIQMLTKLHEGNGFNDEPPPDIPTQPHYSHDTDSDSENENPMPRYENPMPHYDSDDSR
ncbi:hypothetical protein QYE76_021024 [Lolium multiflorum]|uniref:Uncharacterized protein n=1 Tax=Lolium multiflorum TaxID=4521 RepID=A0AAD8R885_LOLMU|nr:hypothetical protein QYE76_021024 [Lolium multiflorum]